MFINVACVKARWFLLQIMINIYIISRLRQHGSGFTTHHNQCHRNSPHEETWVQFITITVKDKSSSDENFYVVYPRSQSMSTKFPACRSTGAVYYIKYMRLELIWWKWQCSLRFTACGSASPCSPLIAVNIIVIQRIVIIKNCDSY